MKKIKIEATFSYDDELMHGDSPIDIEWFYNTILKDRLVVSSNEIGDEIGVMEITKTSEV